MTITHVTIHTAHCTLHTAHWIPHTAGESFQVVLQRASIRESEPKGGQEEELYTLQLAQLIAVAVLLCAV